MKQQNMMNGAETAARTISIGNRGAPNESNASFLDAFTGNKAPYLY